MRLVSHNVFWLQGAPFAGDQPGALDPEVLKGLIALYREMAPDVLCLQELQDASTAAAVGEALSLPHVYVVGGRYPQYGGAVYSRLPLGETPLGETPDRVIQRIRLELPGASARLIVNVHLPSNKHRGREGGAVQRLAELPLIVDGPEAPCDVALGDFNEPPGGPCALALAGWGYVDAAAHDGQGDVPSNIKGRRGDHVWLSAGAVSALRRYVAIPASRLAFTHPTNPEKTHLSDHLPIGVDLRW